MEMPYTCMDNIDNEVLLTMNYQNRSFDVFCFVAFASTDIELRNSPNGVQVISLQ